MEEPNYYAVIPAEIRYDKDLPDKAKLLYGEISALASKTGECWASNKYFADLYGCTTRSISSQINKLKEKGYIDVEIIYNDKKIEKRTIKIKTNLWKNNSIPIEKKFHRDIEKNVNGGIEKNFLDNNTRVNNTRVNNNPLYIPPLKSGEEKKEDLFSNPIIDSFIKQAKEALNQNVYLLQDHREKILELNRAIDDFPAACGDVFNKLKGLNFKYPDRDFKPRIPWLLKGDNFLKVLNGEFSGEEGSAPPAAEGVNTPDELWDFDEFIRQKERERKEKRQI